MKLLLIFLLFVISTLTSINCLAQYEVNDSKDTADYKPARKGDGTIILYDEIVDTFNYRPLIDFKSSTGIKVSIGAANINAQNLTNLENDIASNSSTNASLSSVFRSGFSYGIGIFYTNVLSNKFQLNTELNYLELNSNFISTWNNYKANTRTLSIYSENYMTIKQLSLPILLRYKPFTKKKIFFIFGPQFSYNLTSSKVSSNISGIIIDGTGIKSEYNKQLIANLDSLSTFALGLNFGIGSTLNANGRPIFLDLRFNYQINTLNLVTNDQAYNNEILGSGQVFSQNYQSTLNQSSQKHDFKDWKASTFLVSIGYGIFNQVKLTQQQ
ncbi:MAG: outer membrane beta-barrel protein [Bacteroidota bacterium]|nr:outer membrane beta-barrel protein [Bacteroidota bacterium]